jgi:hypothetical protein
MASPGFSGVRSSSFGRKTADSGRQAGGEEGGGRAEGIVTSRGCSSDSCPSESPKDETEINSGAWNIGNFPVPAVAGLPLALPQSPNDLGNLGKRRS